MPPASHRVERWAEASAVLSILCIGSCAMNNRVAKRIRNGTIESKVAVGV